MVYTVNRKADSRMQVHLDGADLIEGSKKTGSEFKQASVSTGPQDKLEKTQATENWSKSGKTTDTFSVYKKPEKENKSGTVEDVMQQAENMDAAQMEKKMVVAANTTTKTNCRQVEEDGFSLDQTDVNTVVTVVDKIKMQLAKAGVDISCFGDRLSAKQLEEIAGGAAAAQQLAGKIEQQANVPLTEDNVKEFKEAVWQASELTKLEDCALKYMLNHELEPTIENLYHAQYSTSTDVYHSQIGQNGNFSDADFSNMEGQILNIIAQSGRQDTQAAMDDSKWLLQNQVALTAENLNELKQIKELQLPIEKETVMNKIIVAMAEGRRPQDTPLVDDYLWKEQAAQVARVLDEVTDEDLAFVVSKNEPVTLENLLQAHNMIQAGAVSEQETEATRQLVKDSKELENIVGSENLDGLQNTENLGQFEDAGYMQRDADIQVMDSRQIAFITARKQLEEARLAMTIEAGYEMLKNGIRIDISPMEKLIEQLKGIESGYYRSLLTQGGYEATQANLDLFSDTVGKIEDLKYMPSYAIGARNIGVRTLFALHQEGRQMQQNFEQANERYETMQTQVRKDLGDSIQKAFQNVDDILESIGQETTLANERATRILAYNRMEITPENIVKMKSMDQQVQMVFHNMTPAVVREFIGRGINPLDMDIAELNRQAEQIQSELKDGSTDKYSEYLYQLEMNKSITKDERDAFIGIYRLINQVVDIDGAAVGALAAHGTALTMRNLLTEVRSARHGRVDVSVDDDFGELESAGYKDSIINQIESGYQSQCMKQVLNELTPARLQSVMQNENWEDLSPEQFLQELYESEAALQQNEQIQQAEDAYYQQKLDDLEKCAHYPKEVYQMLEQYELPNTVLNAMAVAEQMSERNNVYRRFFHLNPKRSADSTISSDEFMVENRDGETEVDFDAVREELLERFSEDIKKPKELAKAMEEIAECAEKCTSTMILENDVTYLDIRSLKLMNAQMSVNAKMAKAECFSMPVVIDGQVTNVTLKIVRGKKEKGLVNITLQTDNLGKIAAELRAKEKGITGYAVADSKKTCDLLQSMQDEFVKELKQDDMEEPLINFITGTGLNLNDFAAKSGKSEEPQTKQLREVQTKTLYQMAEGFIKVLKRIDRVGL